MDFKLAIINAILCMSGKCVKCVPGVRSIELRFSLRSNGLKSVFFRFVLVCVCVCRWFCNRVAFSLALVFFFFLSIFH